MLHDFWPDFVALMFGQRRRQQPNIKPTLVQYLVYAVMVANMRHKQCWFNVGPTLNQQRVSVFVLVLCIYRVVQ